MRKPPNEGRKLGKAVAKENFPSKVCVVCHRPFTWRKKWERAWDEVTTCSKSCNAQRKSGQPKEAAQKMVEAAGVLVASDDEYGAGSSSEQNTQQQDPVLSTKQMQRKQHK
ncbi:Uncharacterized protein conserved in bacteria (DUF2256) [Seminavis robusta]|uniref:Uncharacterized protein conserved in bacteria (DUF2256) n=1 Tax=Seminavis robusta TaxID=568900 RepID=A0A9N8ECA3_9STRA|nr:Uncharacterized protein conserved in bacteria (DUF2256) [Seminavis robusta]|eukprot:Sro938_g222290.1 Uncharacterized protein conserved in bacteria (DUF2256) (111) ;mRNA; r:13279-13611